MSVDGATRDWLRPVELVLRGGTAAGLVVDAVIHLQLASVYQLAAPGGIGQGNLFRIEAVAAILVACYVLLRGSRLAYTAAFTVAASALAAVLLYRYVDLPAVGPIPSMYEPLWFAKKTATAIAEGLSTVTALAGLLGAHAIQRRYTSGPPFDPPTGAFSRHRVEGRGHE